MEFEMRPYVVSCDLATLWRAAGFVVPDEVVNAFRSELNDAMLASIGAPEWIPERELYEGLSRILADSQFPVVSLDRVYAPREPLIDITRLVDDKLQNAGYGTRDGACMDPVAMVNKASAAIVERDIALVDDVVFSGAMMEYLINLFADRGIRVCHVFAGVAIGEGIERLRARNCPVTAVRKYREVADEICERDFMPGAPLSGRTVLGYDNAGAPYILPFGNVAAWASIPTRFERDFSKRALSAAASFYDALRITCAQLPRRILGLEHEPDTLAGDALRAVMRHLD